MYNDKKEIVAEQSVRKVENGITFCCLDEVGFAYTCFHEFSHPHINPKVDELIKLDANYDASNLANTIKGYSGARAIISESIVRAMESIYIEKIAGKERKESWILDSCDKAGFIKIREISYYIKNNYNESFTSFGEFLPNLYKFIKTL